MKVIKIEVVYERSKVILYTNNGYKFQLSIYFLDDKVLPNTALKPEIYRVSGTPYTLDKFIEVMVEGDILTFVRQTDTRIETDIMYYKAASSYSHVAKLDYFVKE